MRPHVIGVDWGTSTLRAYLAHESGTVLERRERPLGILAVTDGNFEAALESTVGDWLERYRHVPVILSGMIGSRQGWVETRYLGCPADLHSLGSAMSPVDLARGRRIWITSGLSCEDPHGTPDIMRGEEVQILGVIGERDLGPATLCLPGTHSKWVRIQDGRVITFTTHMTGEIFEAIRDHTIISRSILCDGWSDQAFIDGVERAGAAGGLLRHVFGVRTKTLLGRIETRVAAAYLSGLMIGYELSNATEKKMPEITLIGGGRLTELYAMALNHIGHDARTVGPDVAAAGHARLAASLGAQHR